MVEGQVQEYYVSAQKPSKQELFEVIRRECRRHGLPPPGNETVRRRLRAMDPVMIAAGHHGRKTARDRHGPGKEHFEPSTELLGLVEVDHTRVDLIVVDDAYREPIGRPWLTLAIGVFRRVVIGYALTLEPPSSLSVALCMAHMVGNKAPGLAQRGIKASWPAGLPAAVHLYSAAEFHADALVRGCEEHGIIVNYRPVTSQHYGAHIERLVGTMMGEVHLLPGTTFSNVAERSDYDSERRAAMTLAETDLWLTRQIAILYHSAPHQGLGGRTPLGVCAEAAAVGRGRRTAPDAGRVRLDILPFELRRPRRNGIELFRFGYWHDALPALAVRDKAKLPVRYDPRDMSRVWLRPAGETDCLELRLKDLRRPAVMLWEWRAAGTRLRAQGRRGVDEEAQFQAVESNRPLVADARTKISRRQMQRRVAAREGIMSTAAGAFGRDGLLSRPELCAGQGRYCPDQRTGRVHRPRARMRVRRQGARRDRTDRADGWPLRAGPQGHLSRRRDDRHEREPIGRIRLDRTSAAVDSKAMYQVVLEETKDG